MKPKPDRKSVHFEKSNSIIHLKPINTTNESLNSSYSMVDPLIVNDSQIEDDFNPINRS